LNVRAIRWGILGTGTIAHEFCADLRLAPGSELVAVGSRTPARAEALASRHVARHLSVDELITAEVDVVYVATAPDCHREHAIAALRAGKAVLVEKPFARTADEAREIVGEARRTGLFCMEAMWMRFVPTVRELVSAVREGRHGAVRSVEAALGFPSPDPAARGSALLDLGVYPLSLVHALLGAPSAVNAVGDDVETSILLEYEGASATVACSLRSRLRNDALIHAEHATLHLEGPLYRPESYAVLASAPAAGGRPGATRRLARHPRLRRLAQKARGIGAPRVTRRALGHGYAHEAIEVNERLREGATESAVMPLDESVAVLESADAARRSSA
jgi:predicted dehydrogenase